MVIYKSETFEKMRASFSKVAGSLFLHSSFKKEFLDCSQALHNRFLSRSLPDVMNSSLVLNRCQIDYARLLC